MRELRQRIPVESVACFNSIARPVQVCFLQVRNDSAQSCFAFPRVFFCWLSGPSASRYMYVHMAASVLFSSNRQAVVWLELEQSDGGGHCVAGLDRKIGEGKTKR
jgi:hypothetical protein